ncbi:type II toxin-antitoxin system VapC family toxin [Mesorhizobium sp. CGMCC 1.15528]|uniref:Type II toxin-antitoxin system VapC family toxin n=1 Tax=Mesorhizobium zhangyense TaxID=1776730 RepID=A0A7C9R897_9HYPH|nr:type II toxin-antitoxin system VapC family toxin [Mesorhizobium zhangyense]NGN42319.1 type II toxin-antitoxin system VapC family toxin [Mesorhizobium zhangyense]
MKPIGIDTNVLLRMVLNDDPGQRAKALAFGERLTEEMRGFVSLLVLIEFNWSLLSRYRQTKEQTLAAITKLLKIRTLVFEDFDAVVRALERSNFAGVDFADALIAEHNLESGCTHTVTFDQRAAKAIPSMELLA